MFHGIFCLSPPWLILSPSLSLLSVYFSGVVFLRKACHWSAAAPSPTAEKSADRGILHHRPTSRASAGGHVAAVSLWTAAGTWPRRAKPRWAPTSPTGCCWPCACMSPSHTHTHAHAAAAATVRASSHPLAAVSCSTRAGEETVTTSQLRRHFVQTYIHKHLAKHLCSVQKKKKEKTSTHSNF